MDANKTSIYNRLYTSHSDALTALCDAKGYDYKEFDGEFSWKDGPGPNDFGDGPYVILRTNTGKWCIQ